jgi:hypothetical protein
VSARLAAVAGGCLALVAGGCESSQDTSARLEREAVNRPAAKAFVIARANRTIGIGRGTVLQDANGTAVVVPLRSKGSAPLGRVPLSFELLGKSGSRVYRNDTPGLDSSLVEAPVLEPGRRLLWVDDQIQVTGKPVRAKAVAGRPRARLTGPPPRMELGPLELTDDPTEGVAVKGSVKNASTVEQRRLVVFIVARRGGRIVAAGRSIVPRLKVGATAKFTAFLIGDPRKARLSAAVPPTTLP